jgi:hypothetical protein
MINYNVDTDIKPIDSIVAISKRTGALVIAHPVAVVSYTDIGHNNVMLVPKSDIIGYYITIDEDGMFMNNDFVQDEFEFLGEL